MSTDFNCTVQEPEYVNGIMDKLLQDEPEVYARTLYVEQPFAYELEHDMLDVRASPRASRSSSTKARTIGGW